MTLTQNHGCGIDEEKCPCQGDKVRTTKLISTQLGSYIHIVMLITYEILVKLHWKRFLRGIFPKISDVYFQGQTLYCVVNQGLSYEFTFDSHRARVQFYFLTATVRRSYIVGTINRSKLSPSNSLT